MPVNIEAPFNFTQGDSPILVSMPHCGTRLLPSMEQNLTEAAKKLPDTDWYIPELYDFVKQMGISVISANYSRFVIDLNRPVDDTPLYTTKTTGLFPEILFSDRAVFLEGKQFDDATKEQIKSQIWHPYHQQITDELERIKSRFGYAILFDAHSIAAEVPMLFDGTLPDFNFGNNKGLSCSAEVLDNFEKIVKQTQYSYVCNGRFTGGYITRHFGQPEQHIHAIQLELSQATYLADNQSGYQLDNTKKQHIGAVLQPLFQSLLAIGNPSHSATTKN